MAQRETDRARVRFVAATRDPVLDDLHPPCPQLSVLASLGAAMMHR